MDQLAEPNEKQLIEKTKRSPAKDNRVEEEIRYCIEELQKALGARIERILGSQGGLICVLDRVTSEAESLAVKLSMKIPVALIDHFALKGLSRLGAASPLAEAKTYYSPDNREPETGVSRLAALAMEKLSGARVLIDQNMESPALELLIPALLAKTADLAGLDTVKTPAEAVVWIYGEVLPEGIVTGEEAGLIMRAIGLCQAHNIPRDLLVTLLDDVTSFIDEE